MSGISISRMTKIGIELGHLFERDPARGGRAGDFDVGLCLEFFRDDSPDDDRIVHDEHANLLHDFYSSKAPSSESLATSTSGVNGFITYSLAPAVIARCTCSLSVSVVTMTIRTASQARSRRTA